MPSTFVKAQVALDCASLCNSSPPSASCLQLSPSESTAADKARENVVTGIASGNIDWNNALLPIIGDSPECKRSETVRIGDKIVNQGDACAYPFSSKKTDQAPSVVVHVPSRLSADIPAVALQKKVLSRTIAEAPYVAFKSRTVTDEYGGYIQSVSADDRKIYYQTSAPACLAITTR